MAKVGDVFESDIAIYKVVGETKHNYLVERTNKPNHPKAPNMKFPVCRYWKRIFSTYNLKKVKGDEK